MSLTLTLTGKSSVLSVQYFPPIDLHDNEYELGLINFETYNTIPNINSTNNKFYFNNEVITIPEGSYELDAINVALQREILKRHPKDNIEETFLLRANNNTMKSEILTKYQIDFTKPQNIGAILGYSINRVLLPGQWHESDLPVNIISINMLRVECNITSGSYCNGKPVHSIHEFSPTVPPGYKITESPSRVIYLPIVGGVIDDLTIRIVDQNDHLVDFREEEITVRLHVRPRDRRAYT